MTDEGYASRGDLDRLRNDLLHRLDERDRLYTERHDADRLLTDQAFRAARDAIDKAEKAQGEYNIRSNEFRGQLSDQAKELMPRKETEALVHQLTDLIDRLRDEWRQGHEQLGRDMRAADDTLRTEIRSLQDARSDTGGRHSQSVEARAQQNWFVSALIAAAAILATLLWRTH